MGKNVKSLIGVSACRNIMNAEGIQDCKKMIPEIAILRSRATRNAIREMVESRKTEEATARDLIEETYQIASGHTLFSMPATYEAEKESCTALAIRAAKAILSMDGRIEEGDTVIVDIFNEEMEVCVDFYLIEKNKITALAIENGKPVIKKTGRTNTTALNRNLFVYALLKAAEKRGQELGLTQISAKILYLKSEKDKSGKRCSSLTKSDIPELTVPITKMVTSGYDASYKEAKAGHNCSKSECGKCILINHCSYEKTPKGIPAEVKKSGIASMVFTPAQKKVISHHKGVARVIAGAGAGKTTVTVVNVAEMIGSGENPEGICFISYTNASVEATKEKLQEILKDYGFEEDAEKVKVTTFNGLGQEILEKYKTELGFTHSPQVADKVAVFDLITNLLNTTGIVVEDENNQHPYLNISRSARGVVPALADFFSTLKTAGVSEKDDAQKILTEVYGEMTSTKHDQIWVLYGLFKEAMIKANLIDYTDQETFVFDLLEKHPTLFEDYGFEHIIVDEFQDSSKTQMTMVAEMTNTTTFKSLMVVGDDLQSIFGFRGAKVENIINLPQILGLSVKDIYLTDNYRSSDEIVTLSNLIAKNVGNKLPKYLVSKMGGSNPVRICSFEKNKDELEWIAEHIAQMVQDGTPKDSIAYIARTKAEVTKMQSLLTEKGIPAVPDTPVKVLDNSRVKAVVGLAAYFKEQISTISIYNFMDALYEGTFEPTAENQSVINRNVKVMTDLWLTANDKEKRTLFFNLVDNLNRSNDSVYNAFVEILEKYRNSHISKTLSYIVKLDTYDAGLEARIKGNFDAVNIVTTHSAKGMEWENVFFSISKFDKPMSSYSQEEMDEEWRLIFVGATRAKTNLVISSVQAFFDKEDNQIGWHKFMRKLLEDAASLGNSTVSIEYPQ